MLSGPEHETKMPVNLLLQSLEGIEGADDWCRNG